MHSTLYVYSMCILLYILPTKFDTHSSFKLEIIGVDIKDALNLELWPVGILVKKFYSPRSEGKANMARSNSSQEEASSSD